MLALFARPLNCLILQALGKRPMRLADLRQELGGAAQTTLRGRLMDLIALGVVTKRGGGMPYAVENELTDRGRELLGVAEVFAAWLGRAPVRPILLGSVAAKGSIKALAGGWESTMLRVFAARPLSLTQLDSLIAGLSYPALERRLASLRATGLVDPCPNGAGIPYQISRWGREAVGPLVAAARFERTHMQKRSACLMAIDVEAALLLAIPIARLPGCADGSCQLAATTGRESRRLAGVNVVVDRGQVVRCVASLEPKPRTWAMGDGRAWLDAVVGRDTEILRIGGNVDLAERLVFGVHDGIFSFNGNRGAAGT